MLVETIGNKIQKAEQRIVTPVLSKAQVSEIRSKKEQYMKVLNSKKTSDAQMSHLMGEAAICVYQEYLDRIGSLYVPIVDEYDERKSKDRIRSFSISKLVTDKEEKNLDKLVNVYQVLSEEQCNIALIYDRTMENTKVSIGINNTDSDRPHPRVADTYCSRIKEALMGNFPGVEIDTKDNKSVVRGIPESLDGLIEKNEEYSVAIVSNIASDKSTDYISQSMEKLIDGVVPKSSEEEYKIILLASPLDDQLGKINELSQLYARLAPLACWQTNYSNSESTTEGVSKTLGGSVSVGRSSTVGAEIGTGGVGVSASTTKSYNFGAQFSKTATTSIQVGQSEGVIQSFTNYNVKHLLELIEEQIKRYEEGSALGMWSFAAYIISKSPVVANNVAHMYLALSQGEESYRCRSIVRLYDNGNEKRESVKALINNIVRLRHPLFGIPEEGYENNMEYPVVINPCVDITGQELAKALNLPRKSVAGLSVYESVAFGREVRTFEKERDYANTFSLGTVYHMGKATTTPVVLDTDSLAMHTFVTGSTGMGKTNAVCKIIDSITKSDNDKLPKIKFMVIEPAKGEYKTYFADGTSCKTYGTNPDIMPLLRINPFSFPEDVHVLEHIDRLIELINSCWPMYAAMPAVLKSAIEDAYEKSGWNLETSTCDFYGYKRFPTFFDVLESLPDTVNTIGYSSDTTSDYKGALIARVKSLTDGLNGRIFCSSNELTSKELFDENVIIDLSRVGASETKSLIMGILFTKLLEYRIGENGFNQALRHVTILEEAHHLLRKVSTEQFQESSNVQGKAIEMIVNSIAEMRSYGEGFIIADQAPSLLDEAVLRNTNTKIIFRTPNANDRECVGRSCPLNEPQISELSRLPVGTAVVYQNNWIEPVLCAVYKKEFDTELVKYSNKGGKKEEEKGSGIGKKVICKCMGNAFGKITPKETEACFEWIDSLRIKLDTKRIMFRAVTSGDLSTQEKRLVCYNVFKGKELIRSMTQGHKPQDIYDVEYVRDYLVNRWPELVDEDLSRVISPYLLEQVTELMRRSGIDISFERPEQVTKQRG